MPLIPNLSLYLIQKFDRLALWGNLTILELHYAETQVYFTIICNNYFLSFVYVSTTPITDTIKANGAILTNKNSNACSNVPAVPDH